MGFISRPFGILLLWLNNFFGSYGWALIFFTVIVKLILLPLSIKQQKSMQQTQKIQPELAAIQSKYKNDKEKLNEETMKLYKKHNVNPAGGCLPMLIQFPIIIGLYQVVIRPLTYMFNISAEKIAELTTLVNGAIVSGGGAEIAAARQSEILVAQHLTPEILSTAGLENISLINFDFLGLNLGSTPDMQWLNALWIIPILAALTTYLSSKVSMAMSGNTSQPENSAASTMKTMNMIFPLMTAWLAFTMPAGVGLYWIIGNIIQVVQQLALNWYFKSKAPEQQESVIESGSPKSSGTGKKSAKKGGKK